MYGDFTFWNPETTPIYFLDGGETTRYIGDKVVERPSFRIPRDGACPLTPILLKNIPNSPETPVNNRRFLPNPKYYEAFHKWEREKLEWNNKQGNLRIAKDARRKLGKNEYVDSDSIYSSSSKTKPSFLDRAKGFLIKAAIVIVVLKILSVILIH